MVASYTERRGEPGVCHGLYTGGRCDEVPGRLERNFGRDFFDTLVPHVTMIGNLRKNFAGKSSKAVAQAQRTRTPIL